MALCDTCAYYNEDYNTFRQQYDDTIIKGENKEKHYCVMYTDNIPLDITYNNGNCAYYQPK